MSFNGAPSATPKRCKGCIYREEGGISTCNYMLYTGKSRGSSVEDCTHYKKQETNKKVGIFLKG